MSDEHQSLWQSQEVEPVKLSLDELRARAARFNRRIFFRNLREWAACALLVPTFAWLGYTAEHAPLVRLACALEVAGVLYVAFRIARDARALPPPLEASTAEHLAAHRRNLERQRELLLHVARWYVGPLVPGTLLFILGTALEMPVHAGPARWLAAASSLAICGAVFAGVVWLNRLAARKLQRELDALG